VSKAFLRPSTIDDQGFLFKLYATTRADEIAGFGWNDAQKQAFLTIQFQAQQRWYATAYPKADEHIIMQEDAAIGRIVVDRAADRAVLVDIALLPEYRARGFGGALLRNLIEQCRRERLPLRLQVLRTNRAQRLYERLGFRRTGEDPIYLQMEWRPDGSSDTEGNR
jgi:ribosomal protein S18 acetylase RimI-like enzyme